MRFAYPAQVEQHSEDEVVVSFRDVPWCHTSGRDVPEALVEAADALEEAIAWYISEGEAIPMPSAPLSGEYEVALPPEMAAKAALVLAFRASGLSRVALAERLGVPLFRLGGIVSALRRILNVDGYDVLSVDDSSETIELNRELLDTQFGLAGDGE